ncbi:MAG: hypothetical protein H6920_11705 [Sphingomonadaceae bacterium]|jgi:hypothetical protein|nr:hypothetical protein [Sphingomonadaceae bacterium]MCP5383276.1 hypothetical protein [Altererythrobacter sp.]MCP5392273.1 hypothetical protein [Sphingomonadaceae bacterium]MCP5393453.1 hypothetical protein [Sphingomonadaceae bacterium]
MKRSLFGLGALVAAAWASPALAGGGYCTPDWRPENADLGCTSQIAISPGNDTRVNIFLLMQDRAGNNGSQLSYPDLDWYTFYGRNFFRWQNLREAWFPPRQLDEDEGGDGWSIYGGDRCQTIESGKKAFLDALGMRPKMGEEERALLVSSRDTLDKACDDGPGSLGAPGDGGYFVNIGVNGIGDAPLGFMAYLEGSASFYSGQWDRADTYYAMLRDGNTDEWLTETATYMVARNRLNQAIESADDDWGWFDLDKVQALTAKRSEEAFRAYLAKYPDGRYASSARGLIRKALWLQKDFGKLSAIYADLVEKADPAKETTARLVEELDDKWMIREGRGAVGDPLLLAADDLMRMRAYEYEEYGQNPLSAEELAAQADSFADHPELYSFLKANHAFYIAKDYRAVRDLLPDDARQDSYSPLAFSRQYLRGLALHALGDRNEEGFWLELIGGAKGLWQRPAVELSLARVWEQNGKLSKVFESGSPITDSRIRRILLAQSAGPDILKQQVRAGDAHPREQSFALFTVLLKQLQRGEYAGFAKDYPFASKFATQENENGLWGFYDDEIPPLDLFTKGTWSDGFACPSIDKTAATLARNPRDVSARLCLGDFYRLNGFDDFRFSENYWEDEVDAAKPAALGEKDYYPGKVTPRHEFYTSIMDDRGATRDQRAYALYRAIRCYAPANTNTCGGEGVEKSQREAWFRTLKRNYGNTSWAQELKYYW